MKNLKFCITCFVAGALLMAFAPGANADIIVVEGRIASNSSVSATICEGDAGTDTVGQPATGSPGAPGMPPIPEDDPTPPTGGTDDADSECSDDLVDELCDLEEEPDGYICVDIGHGLELCEKEEEDESSTDTTSGDADEEEAGCSGGGGLNPGTALIALLVFAFWALRPKYGAGHR